MTSIDFRPGCNIDLAYIKSSFLKSFRDGEGVQSVPNSFYYLYEQKILKHTLDRCSKAQGIIVAYESLPDDASFGEILEQPILGYIVSEPIVDGLLVHYLYVRGHRRSNDGKVGGRRKGIATALLKEAQRKFNADGPKDALIYTCRSDMCWKEPGIKRWLKTLGATYCPYLRYSLLPHEWECK